MPETPSEPTASPSALLSDSALESTGSRRTGVSRRTVIGAAWSAPVIVAAVAAPFAAASPAGPDASFFWSDSTAYLGRTAQLFLVLPSDSPGVGGQGTIRFTATGAGRASIPFDVYINGQGGWNYTDDVNTNIGIMASNRFAVRSGTNVFSVFFTENSQPGSILATWQNDRESGFLPAIVTVSAPPPPSIEWLTNPVQFGSTTTLRVTVPPGSAGLDEQANLFSREYLPGQATPAFPADTRVDTPAGWTATVLTQTNPATGEVLFSVPVLQTEKLTPGTFDFVYTIGPGTTPVTPTVTLSIQNGAGSLEAPLSIVSP